MTIVAYTYSGYHEINGWRMLKAPYLSRHIFPSAEQQACPFHALVAVFQSDEPGARYEVSPGEGNPNHRLADQYSPPIENGTPILVGAGYILSVWVPPEIVVVDRDVVDHMVGLVAAEKAGKAKKVAP